MNLRYALIFSPLVAAAIAYALTPLVARLSVRVGAVDQPDPRKIHRLPMPRLGGLAVIVAVALTLQLEPSSGGADWAIPPAFGLGLLLGLLPIFAVSLLDDIRPVPARIKFLCHMVGACLAVMSGICLPDHVHVLGYQLSIGLWAIPITIIWLIGVTNAFNIIDGLDGLASGLALISAVAVSAVFVTNGQLASAILPLALAGAIAGFLPYNLYPARIFLGDTGATAIGFTLAVVALKGGAAMSAGFAAATPILILGLPIADTLVAIARRLLRWAEYRVGGVFQPDRNHVHHRLLALGLNHSHAVFVLYGLGAVTAAVAYLSLFVSSRESALLLLVLFIAGGIGLKHLRYDEFALLRRGTILRFYETPMVRWSMFVVLVDISSVCLSAYLAVALKTDDWLLQSNGAMVVRAAALLVPLSLLVFWKARLYGGSWRLAKIDDYVRAAMACGLVLFVALVVYRWQLELLAASLLIVYGLLSVFFVVGARASYRVLVSAQRAAGPAGVATLLYGPGPDDFAQARDLIDRATSFGLRPVGLVTAAGAGRGQLLAGVEILGSLDELPQLAAVSGAQAVVLSRPRASDAMVRRFERLCRVAKVVPYRLNIELETLWNDEIDDPIPTPFSADGPQEVHVHRQRDLIGMPPSLAYQASHQENLRPQSRRRSDGVGGSPSAEISPLLNP